MYYLSRRSRFGPNSTRFRRIALDAGQLRARNRAVRGRGRPSGVWLSARVIPASDVPDDLVAQVMWTSVHELL
jgi:hypothetical protein